MAGLYSTSEWQRLRRYHLSRNPLCVMCEAQGRITAATVVDHIKPHKGDRALFFDPDNLQSLCKTHHDSTKQRQEKTGRLPGCDESGVPLDAGHHWRR